MRETEKERKKEREIEREREIEVLIFFSKKNTMKHLLSSELIKPE